MMMMLVLKKNIYIKLKVKYKKKSLDEIKNDSECDLKHSLSHH